MKTKAMFKELWKISPYHRCILQTEILSKGEQSKIQAEISTQRVSYDVVSDDVLALASGAGKQLEASYESTNKKAEEP